VSGRGEGGYVITAFDRALAVAKDLVLDAPPLTEDFSTPTDEHVYHFTLAGPTTIDLSAVPVNGSLLDTRLTLIGPSGRGLAIAGSGTASVLSDVRLLAAGTYTVLVRPELPGGGLGGYTVNFTTGTTTTITPEPDTTITFGTEQAASIPTNGADFQLSLTVAA